MIPISRWSKRLLLPALLLTVLGVLPARQALAQSGGSASLTARSERLTAVPAGRTPPMRTLSGAEREALLARVDARREAEAQRWGAVQPRQTVPARRADGLVPQPTRLQTVEAAGDLVTVRNVANPVAAGASGQTLAEPAAAHRGDDVFYTGNTYASYSVDGGTAFTEVTIPAGPADAPSLCCDLDVMYDPVTDKFYWIGLYINGAATNGVVRIFVQTLVNQPYDCFFDVDPGGSADNILPDYPHLGLTNTYLYLTTNNNDEWQVRRMPLTELVGCSSASVQIVSVPHTTYGQRVVVPARGTVTTMYWALLEAVSGSPTQAAGLRVFSWPDSSGVVNHSSQPIQTSEHTNPDCRGGTGNYDWIERTTAWGMTGFRLRGAVGGGKLFFAWNSAPTGGFPNAHIRAALLDEATLAVQDQPHLWSADWCAGFPQVAFNSSGHLGITGAFGGKHGGSGLAAQGFVSVNDDLTTGNAYAPLMTVATGTHNRTDSRYGDYTTIVRHQVCPDLWTATAYALNGGAAVTNVNARYVEFGRERDTCASVPAAPGNLRSTGATSSTIALAWDDVSNETEYFGSYLKYGTGDYIPFAPAANATSFTLTGLESGTIYYVYLQACNTGGCSPYAPTLNAATAPLLPSNFRSTSTSSSGIALAWNDTGGEARYEVLWVISTAPTTYTTVTLTSNVTSWTHSTVTPGATYYYWLRACLGQACSGYTGAVVATASEPPPTPGNFRKTSTGATWIDLAWNDVVGESSYQLAWVLSTAPSNFTYYNFSVNQTSYSHTVSPNLTYYYWLRACNGSVCSGWAPAVTATAAPTPSVPAGLRVTSSSSSAINLAWNDVSGETRYLIAWTASAPISYNFPEFAANTTSFNHATVAAGSSYYYHVAACAGVNCSNWSGGIAATAATAPPIPSNFRVTAVTGGSLTLEWDDVTGETAYQIAYTKTSPITYLYQSTPPNMTVVVLSGLQAATSYYLHIRACTGFTCSNFHGGIVGTTAGARPDGGSRVTALPPPDAPPPGLRRIEISGLPAPGAVLREMAPVDGPPANAPAPGSERHQPGLPPAASPGASGGSRR